MRTLLLPALTGLLLTGLLLAGPGCTTLRAPSASGADGPTLQAENQRLRAELQLLRDSLRTADDVATGRHYRDLRVLHNRVDRLTYELSLLRDGGQTFATVSADELFQPATATLSSAGTARLSELGTRLMETYSGRRLRIEGHADDTPLSPGMQERFPSNWELSAARAAAVARHLIDTLEWPPDRFVIVGFGSTEPIASNDTAAGRRQNRRVRIAVLPTARDFSRPLDTAW